MSYYYYWYIPVSTVRGDDNKFRIVAEGLIIIIGTYLFQQSEVTSISSGL